MLNKTVNGGVMRGTRDSVIYLGMCFGGVTHSQNILKYSFLVVGQNVGLDRCRGCFRFLLLSSAFI